MPTESSIEILPSELAQIVESVFETMLSLEMSECNRLVSQRGSVDIRCPSGRRLEWSAVLLECATRQACPFAGRFLSIDPPETVDDVVRDVLGELANMIGGNLKCVLPQGSGFPCPPWWTGATTACASAGQGSGSGSPFSVPRVFFLSLC